MKPSYKILSALLILAACVCLPISDLTLGPYGDFRIPLHTQIGACYPVLVIAILFAGSKRLTWWILGVISVQVTFTFITCFALPHLLASTLETVIPYVGIGQLVVAFLLLAGVLYERQVAA